MSKAIARFPGMPEAVEVTVHLAKNSLEHNGSVYPLQNAIMEPPIAGNVYSTFLNYKGALAALGDAVHNPPYNAPPKAPILYIKTANTLNGHGKDVPIPDHVEALEAGAALAVVIGRQATRVSELEALHYVAGYTIGCDISIPHENYFRPALREKSRDGFMPIGPWIIHRDEVPNPDALAIRVYINGELCQQNNTSNQIRSVSRLIADVTEFMTLFAGDTLLVGVPEGAPHAKPGDHIQIEIDHVGTLETKIAPRLTPSLN